MDALDRIGALSSIVLVDAEIVAPAVLKQVIGFAAPSFVAYSPGEVAKIAKFAPRAEILLRVGPRVDLEQLIERASGAVDRGLTIAGACVDVSSGALTDWSESVDLVRQLFDESLIPETTRRPQVVLTGLFQEHRAVLAPSIGALREVLYDVQRERSADIMVESGEYLCKDSVIALSSVTAKEIGDDSTRLHLDVGRGHGFSNRRGVTKSATPFQLGTITAESESYTIFGMNNEIEFSEVRLPSAIDLGDVVVLPGVGTRCVGPTTHSRLEGTLHFSVSSSISLSSLRRSDQTPTNPEDSDEVWLLDGISYEHESSVEFAQVLAFERDCMRRVYGFDAESIFGDYNSSGGFFTAREGIPVVAALRGIRGMSASLQQFIHSYELGAIWLEDGVPERTVEIATLSSTNVARSNRHVARLFASFLRCWIFGRAGRFVVAGIDAHVLDVLTRRFEFKFEAMGEARQYLGSLSVPVLLDLENQFDFYASQRTDLFDRLLRKRDSAVARDLLQLRTLV